MPDPIGVVVNTDATVTLYRDGKKHWRGPVSGLMAQLTGEAAPLSSKRPRKQKAPSRGQRWSDACTAATAALEELQEIQGEFSDWKDNLPENLQQSALGEKLDAMVDLDIEGALSTVQDAEGADLPLGFGRD